MNTSPDALKWLTFLGKIMLPLGLAFTPTLSVAQSDNRDQSKWYQSTINDSSQNVPLSFDKSANSNSPNNTSATASLVVATRDDSAGEWLNPFGVLRLQADTESKFKVNSTHADLNVPMYDSQAALVFTQLGYHHQDDQNTGNLGVGWRQWVGDWMFGLNVFFDNQYSGDQRRLGLGAEAWRDYLKFSANSYFGPSDMQTAHNVASNAARPATGYDIRAEGWLPAFPMLGVRIMAEHYQGNNIVLLGEGSQQTNPWVLTSGLSLTPIPLVTLGAQYRAGKAGQNDSQLYLQIHYRLGVNWRQQIDVNQIDALRRLSVSRYDVIERNNSIALH